MGDSNLPSIPAKFCKGGFLIGTPCWVSNGLWAVRRSAISNECLFQPRVAEVALGAEEFRELSDEKFDRMLPVRLAVQTYERDVVGLIGTTQEQNAVGFRCAETGKIVMLREQFVRLFGLHTLYGRAYGELLFRGEVDDEWSPVLMAADLIIAPVKLEEVAWRSVMSLANHIHAGDGRQGRLFDPPKVDTSVASSNGASAADSVKQNAPDASEPGYTPTVTLAEDSPQQAAGEAGDAPAAETVQEHEDHEEAAAVPTPAGEVASSTPDTRMPHEILADMTQDIPDLGHLIETAAFGQLELALSALKGKHGAEARRVAIRRELRKRGRTEPELPPLEDKRECACGHVAEKHYAINDHIAGCSVKGCLCTKFVEVQELFGEDAPEPDDDGDYDAGEDFDEAS